MSNIENVLLSSIFGHLFLSFSSIETSNSTLHLHTIFHLEDLQILVIEEAYRKAMHTPIGHNARPSEPKFVKRFSFFL